MFSDFLCVLEWEGPKVLAHFRTKVRQQVDFVVPHCETLYYYKILVTVNVKINGYLVVL